MKVLKEGNLWSRIFACTYKEHGFECQAEFEANEEDLRWSSCNIAPTDDEQRFYEDGTFFFGFSVKCPRCGNPIYLEIPKLVFKRQWKKRNEMKY